MLGEGAIVLLVPRNSLLVEKLSHQMRFSNGAKSSDSISLLEPGEKNTLPFLELVSLRFETRDTWWWSDIRSTHINLIHIDQCKAHITY